MLISFRLINFLSFKNETEFSLVATTDSDFEEDNLFKMPSPFQNTNLLKVCAIYGANASGKSNLFKAIIFMKEFVLNSSTNLRIDEPIPIEPFLLSDLSPLQPSLLEISFYYQENLYKYGFELTKKEVTAEWLLQRPHAGKFRTLFRREQDNITISDMYFKEGHKLDVKTRSNGLFLSVVAQFNGQISLLLMNYFARINIISGLEDRGYFGYTINFLLQSESKLTQAISMMKTSDLSIQNIRIKKEQTVNELALDKSSSRPVRGNTPTQFTIRSKHNVYSDEGEILREEEFDFLRQESTGTQKYFSLSGPLIDTLESGKILLIDELDSQLHPLIIDSIIRTFNSSLLNKNQAQLIFSAHNTHLLTGNMRRDQIYIVDKNREGASEIYSLSDFKDSGKSIRKGMAIEKNYLKGLFGGIPNIGQNFRVTKDGISQ